MDFFYQDEKIDYHSDLYLKLIHSGIISTFLGRNQTRIRSLRVDGETVQVKVFLYGQNRTFSR